MRDRRIRLQGLVKVRACPFTVIFYVLGLLMIYLMYFVF